MPNLTDKIPPSQLTRSAHPQAPAGESWLQDRSDMDARMRAKDWSKTPLGPAHSWSPALRTMTSILLANRSPMLLWWGPDSISIYNDACIPVLGAKHPNALGLPVRECWSEIYDVLRPLIQTALRGGPPAWSDDLPLDIRRHGSLEETHWTVAYSPVPDETAPGGIGGVLATMHEITAQVVGQRRDGLLRDLAARSLEAKTAEEACATAAAVFARYPHDVPFALLYLLDRDRRSARLAGAAGIAPGGAESPSFLDSTQETGAKGWPIAEVVRTEAAQLVDDLGSRFPSLLQTPWSEAPRQALVMPIGSNLPHRPAGVVVAGVSPRLTLDASHRGFFDLAASQLTKAIANARAYEEERLRAESLAELDRTKTAFFGKASRELQAPDLLRESEERLRLFIDHAPAALAMFDRDMRYLSASRRWMEDYRLGSADLRGRWHYDIFPDLPERWKEAHRQGLAGKVVGVEEDRFDWPDGSVQYVRWELHPWHDAAGRVGGIVLFTEDITERKLAELALQDANERLRETDRQRDELIAMLSHELRNPLAPIVSCLEVLSRTAPGSAKAERAMSIIGRQVDHLRHIIDDLLEVTRIARGKVSLTTQLVNLNVTAMRIVEDHRPEFAKAGVLLSFEPAPRPLFANADPIRLAQVLGNLLQNAAKFTPRGGRTDVAISPAGSGADTKALIRVTDTGRGIEAALLERLFDPFTQADSSLDRQKGGLGLGLAVAKGLMELHGGTIRAESRGVGQGTTMIVTLPLQEPAPRSALEEVAAEHVVHRRVLVIEDNDDAREALRDLLELEEHEVEVADNGEEGLEKARAFRPEVVLCDIGLPGIDGYEVARRFRTEEGLRGAELVALSGYARPEDVARGKEAGFDAHLAKPPKVSTLRQLLRGTTDHPD